MNPFVRFMVSPVGRITRLVGGTALIAVGLLGVGGVPGLAMAVFGLMPMTTGMFDLCVMGVPFRLPLRGSRLRARQ